jgi:hypothetical protein
MDTEELDPLDEEFDYAERQPDLTKVPEWAKEAYKPLEEGGYELGWQSIKDKFRQSREFKAAHEAKTVGLLISFAAY